MTSVLSAIHFHNEAEAYDYVESRLWPTGPVCPHCGNVDQAKIGRLQGKTSRAGMRKCYECRKAFTVKMGAIFEYSHAPLRLWLQAVHLMCSSKKGISTRQLQRILGVGMKTAWFMGHRIRAAMAPAPDDMEPMGGEGITVEADEMFLNKSIKTRKKPGERKAQVLSLVERGGNIRSVYLDHRTVRSALAEHLDYKSRLVTDKAAMYTKLLPVGQHEAVDHSKFEFARGDVHTNTLEGFFSIFKRGIVGVYQHIDKGHLPRYLAEFDFRQNNRAKLGIDDVQRADVALRGFKGKRLTYTTPRSGKPGLAPERSQA